MASFSLNEGNKGIGLRSLGKVDNLHNAPRTGPQQMVAVSLGHPMVPICAHPGPVVSPKLASGLVLPDKLVHLPFMGPFSRSSPRANSDQTPCWQGTHCEPDWACPDPGHPTARRKPEAWGLHVARWQGPSSQGEVTGGTFQTTKWHLPFHSNEGW